MDNARERTIRALNIELFDDSDTTGRWQMPIIHRETFVPEQITSFRYIKRGYQGTAGIHCFCYDSELDRMWKNPLGYIDRLKAYSCVCSPDFSLYLDMPAAQKINNVYRSRLIGHLYQNIGLTVIPTVQWAELDSFDYCFDGIESGGTIAVSSVGVLRDKESHSIFCQGLREALNRIKPKSVILYGGDVDFDFGDINVVRFKQDATKWREEHGKRRTEKRGQQACRCIKDAGADREREADCMGKGH